MIRTTVIPILALMLGACATAPAPSPASFADDRWIDLTHDLSEDSVFWPTANPFRHDTVFEGETEGGWYYSAYNIVTSEHGGTHLDAPIHFFEGAQTTDEIPLENLIGPAAVVDVSESALANRDYQFTVQDVLDWEAVHGRLPDGAILLFHTGYARFWPDAEAYMGTAERGEAAVSQLHFPGLSPELAQFLVDEREIRAVGLDTPSLDYGQTQDFMVHRILFADNIPGFENVAGLDQLPPLGATVIALPMKIRGGSGGPLRIVAHLPESR
ncbi:MAG: cyclase family protein [Parasphingopyxis sp.]|uniref:cyclase family protein n=1 Tax=Parasphingopyxis sp. TaxID=1920299 RepID=UPI003F9F9460